ncbi:MAG: hypothetical protein QOE11_1121 [Solirubrobacteraceae bacterium]|nr:hypothetical protein [Solirubrobacteraceae bacterium]
MSADLVDASIGVWIRKQRRVRRSGGFWLALSVGSVAGWLATAFGTGATLGSVLVTALFLLAPAGLYGFVGVRMLRAGLWIDADGIVIRNPLVTYRFTIAQAQRFTPGLWSAVSSNGTPCPLLENSIGAAIGVWALGKDTSIFTSADYLEVLQPVCDELSRMLESLHAMPPAA